MWSFFANKLAQVLYFISRNAQNLYYIFESKCAQILDYCRSHFPTATKIFLNIAGLGVLATMFYFYNIFGIILGVSVGIPLAIALVFFASDFIHSCSEPIKYGIVNSLSRMYSFFSPNKAKSIIENYENKRASKLIDYFASPSQFFPLYLQSYDLRILANALQNEGAIEEFHVRQNVHGCKISDLVRILQNIATLKTLILTRIKLDDTEIAAVSDLLKRNPNIRELDLSRNIISNEGAEILAKAITFLTKLQRLDVSGNPIGDIGAIALINSVMTHPSINEFQLFDKFSYQDAGTLMNTPAVLQAYQSLIKNKPLTKLLLNIRFINQNTINAISAMYAQNQSGALTDLTFFNNEQQEHNPQQSLDLGELVGPQSRLESLTFKDNTFTNSDIETLAMHLESNKTLACLTFENYMFKSRINDVSAFAIANALAANSNLRSLIVYGEGQITQEGAKALASAIQHNLTLECFYLYKQEFNSGFKFANTGCIALRNAVAVSNRTRKNLLFAYEYLEKQGIITFSTNAQGVIQTTTTLPADIIRNRIAPFLGGIPCTELYLSM